MKAEAIAKALVVNGSGKLLLLRRSKTAPRRALQWDLPGGIVDEGDFSYAAACAREAKEEAGLEIAADQMQLVYAESAVQTDNAQMVLTWLYFLAQAPGVPGVTLSFEHDQFQWVGLDEAIKMTEYDRHLRLLKYIRDNKLIG